MQQEIFGPILPIITYDSMDEVIPKINSMSHPLALYIFTSRRKTARKFMEQCSFGGGCINDTLIHLATSEMGFGGFQVKVEWVLITVKKDFGPSHITRAS